MLRPRNRSAQARAAGGYCDGVERDHVVGDDVAEVLEPEGRQLRQDAPLVRDAGPEHVIEGRDAVRGNDDEDVAGRVDVAHLAGAEALETRNVSVQNGERWAARSRTSARGRMLTDALRMRQNASRGPRKGPIPI